nr:hypothetical protein BaRGS_024699 [Batillaria attramentaria]
MMTTDDDDDDDKNDDDESDAQIGFLVVLFLLIVAGNAIVLAAIALSRERRRSRMNFFIMHLAVCDLLTGPLVVLSDLIQKLTTYCFQIKEMQVSVMYASTYMLVALSVDRLDAVARPMQFSGSCEPTGGLRARILVGTAWVLSLLFALPELILFRVDTQFGGPMCMIDFTETWQWQAYLTPIAITLFIIPAVIICICYVIIIVIIWRSSHILQQGSRHRGKHREEVFIVCWSPYFIFNLCQVYGAVPNTVDWMKFATFIQSMAPLNSAANPVIYGIFSTRICKYLRRVSMFRRLSEQICQCCAEESPGHTASGNDYSSMTETEEIRMSGDLRANHHSSSRVPYVKQKLSEADRALLSLHIRTKSEDV